MKKILGIFYLLSLAILAVSQVPPITPPIPRTSQGNQAGLLYASNFGQWQVPPGNLGTYSWGSASYCYANTVGVTFQAFTVGTPIQIVDVGNPSATETVTPSAVTIIPAAGPLAGSCSITIAPVHAHSTNYYYTSGTAGLQEAINWAATSTNTYNVVLTPDWTTLGGTNAMITAATGNANISILDERTGVVAGFSWNGGSFQYLPSGVVCTGSGTAQVCTFSGTVAAGTSGTPSYPANIGSTNQVLTYQFNNSRYGRVSAASLPQLARARRNYSFAAAPNTYIACFGSSVGVSANIADPATNSPCGHAVADLNTYWPGYNYKAVNMSVNGSVSSQFPAAWAEYTTYALSGVTIHTPGTGYAVGDWEIVNQVSANSPAGHVIVTAVTGGVPTAIAISPYPGCITMADSSTPSTSRYSVASNVPTINGTAAACSITEQTGTGSGLTVNITSVGYAAPAAALFVYGMNDGNGALTYNGGQIYSGGVNALAGAINQVNSLASDAIVMTSVHPSVVWTGSGQWTWNSAVPCLLSDFMTICDPASSGNTSVVNQVASVDTRDFAGLGTPITVSKRIEQVNQAYRSAATDQKAAVIDSEYYWFEALECASAAAGPSCLGLTGQGSQLAGEQYLFGVAGPHPNLLGHQKSYQRAEDDFFKALATQTAQPFSVSDFPYTTSDNNTTVTRNVQTLGTANGPLNLYISPITSGTIKIFARPQNTSIGEVIGVYAYSSNNNAIQLGADTGTNQGGVFSISVSGLTVTVNPIYGTTAFSAVVDTLTTAGTPVGSGGGGTTPNFAFSNLAATGSYNTYVMANGTSSTTNWVLLGTWTAPSQGSPLSITINSASGNYATGYGTQAISDLIVQSGNQGGAPNLNGMSVFTFGAKPTGYGLPILAAKAYAHGGSTSSTNQVWDIYVQMNTYSPGTYTVNIPAGATWVNTNVVGSDPGAASSTVLVGIVSNPIDYAGSLTYIGPVVTGGATNTINCTSGTVTSGSYTWTTQTTGKVVNTQLGLAVATVGSCTGNYKVLLPFTPNLSASVPCTLGGNLGQMTVTSGSTTAYVNNYSGSNSPANGQTAICGPTPLVSQ